MQKKIKIGLVCLAGISLAAFGFFLIDKLNGRTPETIGSCKGDSLYEKQALFYDYEVHFNYVRVAGAISKGPGVPISSEESLDLYIGRKFYLPSGKEQSVSVKLEKIRDNKAYFIFSYGAAPPACEAVGGCDYSCEFIKPAK